MIEQFDFWQFFGGIGLFVFAMAQLELGLKSFVKRSLKRFLQHHTNNPLKSIGVGTLATALVQSSSLVGLMVLAFAGASVLSLENAIGVIIGANLGTTFTGWLVATVGFKLELELAALPLIGFGSLLLVALQGRPAEVGRIMTALGLLLLGLSLMKSSVGSAAEGFDASRLAQLHAWQYLLFGVVFAAIVQSSSAVMMVVLAALNTGVIELPSAAAVAIGADLGTTGTILIGAVQGAGIKKRVALAHVLFNAATAVIAFSFLLPLLKLVQGIGITDPLYSLVAFHSLFNLAGIIIFLPFVKPFARFLEGRFIKRDSIESHFVSQTETSVSDAAMVAIAEETAHIISRVIHLNLLAFTPPIPPPGPLPVLAPADKDTADEGYDDLYIRNKRLEGEILTFALKVQEQPLEANQSKRLNQLLSSVRHAVHSAKSLRDIRHNLDEFAESPRRDVSDYLNAFRELTAEFYGEVYRLWAGQKGHASIQDYATLQSRVGQRHDQLHQEIYSDIHRGQLADSEISSLLNVNRELLNSNIGMLTALQDYSFDAHKTENGI